MTPDEIRVAIRMTNEPVYWKGKWPVFHDSKAGYCVLFRDPMAEDKRGLMPIFEKDGTFGVLPYHWGNGILGMRGKPFSPEDFSTEYILEGINPK